MSSITAGPRYPMQKRNVITLFSVQRNGKLERTQNFLMKHCKTYSRLNAIRIRFIFVCYCKLIIRIRRNEIELLNIVIDFQCSGVSV